MQEPTNIGEKITDPLTKQLPKTTESISETLQNQTTSLKNSLTKPLNEAISLNDLKNANDKFKEVIEKIPETTQSISDELQKQATSLKSSFENMIPDLNTPNVELSKNLESLLKKVDELRAQNSDKKTHTTLGEVKVINEFEADNAALVIIKDMILSELYMNYLKYFKSILIVIRDSLLPNYNAIQQAKKENKEIIDQLEGVLNDPEIQEKWNIVLKTLAVQLSRFIFIIVMFADILMQKLGDVGNRFIVEFVNQNSDSIIRILINSLKSIPIAGGVIASADSLLRTLDSILNLGLITSYSFIDSVRIPADGILRGKYFDELQKTRENTANTIDNIVTTINNKRENKNASIPSPVPPQPAALSEPKQEGQGKKRKKRKRPKQSKKKTRKQSKQKKTKKKQKKQN